MKTSKRKRRSEIEQWTNGLLVTAKDGSSQKASETVESEEKTDGKINNQTDSKTDNKTENKTKNKTEPAPILDAPKPAETELKATVQAVTEAELDTAVVAEKAV